MEYQINTFDELIKCISEISLGEEILWYRGQSNSSWELVPTIARSYNFEIEKEMVAEFKWMARTRYSKCPEDDNFHEWISLMQHFGMPTRLLDWSKSPLVAMYFALFEKGKILKDNNDSCIYVLKPRLLNKYYNHGNAILSLDSKVSYAAIAPAFKNVFVVNRDFIVATSANEIDNRMLLQQSAFTIHNDYKKFDQELFNLGVISKILIPNDNKINLAESLIKLGVSHSAIFPDLDNLSMDLIFKYSQAKYK